MRQAGRLNRTCFLMMRLTKWGLLLAGLGWAGYFCCGLYTVYVIGPLLNRLNHCAALRVPFAFSEVGDSIIAFAVGFGPAVLAGLFLKARWPESRLNSEPP